MELTPSASQEKHVSDGSEATFMQDVVAASKDQPVIVDFWAPWCGPCKTLGPALEAAVNAQGGRVKMVKLDVDRAQNIATQLQIQSIPTVYAFHNGQAVDGFQGAMPPSEVEAFVKKIADLAGPADEGLSDAVLAADTMLDEGQIEDAMEVYSAILEQDPTIVAAYAGLARAHLALDQAQQAEAVLNGVPAELSHDPQIESLFAQIELNRQAEAAGPTDALRAKLQADPNDHQARLDLAAALQAEGDKAAAIDELLEAFRRDREWNEGAAKAQLLKLLDALGPKDPIGQAGRRKLSSLIFV